MKEQLDKQAAYRREAARLRTEEQQEERERKAYTQQQQKYMILEKHINMQQKLEIKKHAIAHKGKAALEQGM